MTPFAEQEGLVRYDPGGRGLAATLEPGALLRAAEVLSEADTVAIATGFFIPAAHAVESDGPPGATFLARALERAGKSVVMLGAKSATAALELCKKQLGLNFTIFELEVGEAPLDLWQDLPCAAFVALEYPGQAADGRCRNMRGVDISAHVPALDSALAKAKSLGISTIAIGDGGNELGCGRAGRDIGAHGGGFSIAAQSDADIVIPAGTSNWGAYAVISVLSVLRGENLVPTASEEHELLRRLSALGVVDGCTLRFEPTVDGLSEAECAGFLRELHALTTRQLKEEKNCI